MQARTAWNVTPYRPFLFDRGEIYICRVAPERNGISFAWLPLEDADEYQIFFGKRGAEKNCIGSTTQCAYCVENLECGTEYQFQVCCGARKSLVRLARTGEHVGTVVNYLHPEDAYYAFSGQYLCSPSLVRHPDGHLLAAMDLYAADAPQNLSLLFRSDDDGDTWHYVTELYPCFWPKLFIHRGILYVLACSTEYGDLLIGCSKDGGSSFSSPQVILRGSCNPGWPGVHKNPQPVIERDGRLWNSIEWGCWRQRTHAASVISAAADADLLRPESWHITPPLPYDPAWPGTAKGESAGSLEGTLVSAPDGRLLDVMRYEMAGCTPNFGTVLAYEVNTKDPDAQLRFDHAISFPANHAKFEIRLDPVSGCYVSIADRILSSDTPAQRNVLSLLYSRDLEHWHTALDLLDYHHADPAYTGFQYVDFLIEGSDLLFLCRTAMNHAHSFHDSNYSTFHRLKDFRKYLLGGKSCGVQSSTSSD